MSYWCYVLREMITDFRFAWRFRGKKFYVHGVPCGPLVIRTYKRRYGRGIAALVLKAR